MERDRAMQILGVQPGSTPEAVKRAYREQVKLWHPDRYSPGSSLKQIAQRNLQDANQAYALLRRGFRNPPSSLPARPLPTPLQSGDDKAPAGRPAHPASPLQSLLKAFWVKLLPLLDRMDRNRSVPFLRWFCDPSLNRYRPWYHYPDHMPPGNRRNRPKAFARFLERALGTDPYRGETSPGRRPSASSGIPTTAFHARHHRMANLSRKQGSIRVDPVAPGNSGGRIRRHPDGDS